MNEKEKLTEIAYFAEETYRTQHNKDAMINIVSKKYPSLSSDVISGMIYAIDAYADMNK